MSTSIDERVVEMRFDNKAFEANAKDSLDTIERLKQALNFSTSKKGLTGIDRSVKTDALSGIAEGVDILTKRFSTMGIIGMRVVENLTDSVMNRLGKAISYVTSSIKSGGITRAMNLEKAHFQLQSIIGDEAGVQEVMNSANKSVDGTAYSFDVAAKAASQFYASGVTDMADMDLALRGLVGTTATFSADYGQMSMIWAQVAGQGRLMGDQLLQLSTRGANAAVEIAKFMNGVNDGSIEASDSVKKAVRSVSKATNNTEADIREFVSKGKINFSVFAAAMNHAFGDSAAKANETFDGALSNIKSALARIGAGFVSPLIAQNSEIVRLFNSVRLKINDVKSALVFDEAIGNVNALSKQVTDFVLNTAGGLADFVDKLDLTKPLQAFYYGVEAIKNVLKGLLSIILPVGHSIRYSLFQGFSADTLVNFAKKLKEVTSGFRLTGRNANNLRATLRGVFNIIRLLADGIVKLIGLFIPLNKPIGSLGSSLLEITGYLGKNLSAFSRWVRQSSVIRAAYNGVRNTIQAVMTSVANFINKVRDLRIVQNTFDGIGRVLAYLGAVCAPYISKINDLLYELRIRMQDSISDFAVKKWNEFITFLSNLRSKIKEVDLGPVTDALDKFKSKVKEFFDIILDSEGIDEFVKNMKAFFGTMKEGFGENTIFEKIRSFFNLFTLDKLVENLEKIQKSIGKFVTWIKKTVGPAFEDVSVGGVIATGSGIGMVYAFLKMAKPFEEIARIFSNVPKIFDGLKGAIKAYQDDLKASQLLKISSAIGILAGTLILLSFADLDRVLKATGVLALIAGSLLYGSARLLEAAKKGRDASGFTFQLGVGLKRAMSKLAGAIRLKALGSMLKSFGSTILMITGSIIALALMYKKDESSIKAALVIVGGIMGSLVIIIGLMSFLGNKLSTGMKGFSKAATGILMLSLSLTITISALKKIFSLEIPDDAETRFKILGGVFVALGVLALAIGGAASISGGNAIKATGSILALSVMLLAAVKSLKEIFELDIDDEGKWKIRMSLLMGIFAALSVLIISIGAASALAKGKMKATGAILSMCLFVATATGALMILQNMPGDKLMDGAKALGVVLLGLAAALIGAGKITNKDTNKTVFAMALVVGAITAALGVLSMISWKSLIKAAGSLGVVLLMFAKDLEAAAKASVKGSKSSIMMMAGALVVIAGALVVLSTKPWKNMLASGVAMGAVLLAFSKALDSISATRGIKTDKLKGILLALVALAPIAAALYVLSGKPWSGMLSAGVAMGTVLLAFSESMAVISGLRGIKQEKVTAFLTASLAVIPIGIALSEIASFPWSGILAGAGAISGTLLALSLVFKMINGTSPNQASVLAFVGAAISLIPIAAAIKILGGEDWKTLLPGVISLNATALVLVGLLALLSNMPSAVAGAAAFALAAVALIPVAGAMKILSGLSWGEVAKGLITLAGALAIIGVAGLVIGPISPLILALSAALIAFGVAIAAVGVGLLTFVSSLKLSLDLFGKMMSSLGKNIKDVQAAGKNLVAGFISGMASKLGDLVKAAAAVGKAVLTTIKGVLGIHSPSTEAMTLGEYTDEGFAKGLLNGEGTVDGALDSVFGDLGSEIDVSSLFGIGSEGSENFAEGLISGESNVSSALNSVMGDSANNIDLSKFFGAGAAGTSKLLDGLKSDDSSITSGLNSLMGNSASNVDLSSLYSTGSQGGSQFLQGFQNGASTASASSTSAQVITNLVTALRSSLYSQDFGSYGKTIIMSITKGIQSSGASMATYMGSLFRSSGIVATTSWTKALSSNYPNVTKAGTEIAKVCITAITKMLPEFTNQGKKGVDNFINGLRSKASSATSVGRSIAQYALNGMNAVSFYSAGANATQGFINGIRSKESGAYAAGSAIGNAAYTAAKKALKEKSPSKAMYQVGDFAGVGFINGIVPYISEAANAGDDLGNATIKALSDATSAISDRMNDDFDLNPTITPVINMTEAEQSAKLLNDMFNQAIETQMKSVDLAASSFNTTTRPRSGYDANNPYGKVENNYNMTQVNNSPKALSRMEIYKDTQNLISQIKEVNNR